jgi:hypothetical protein
MSETEESYARQGSPCFNGLRLHLAPHLGNANDSHPSRVLAFALDPNGAGASAGHKCHRLTLRNQYREAIMPKSAPSAFQSKTFLIGLLVSFLSFQWSAGADEKGGRAGAWRSSAKTDGVQIAITLDKGSTAATCPLVVEVTNLGRKQIGISHYASLPDFAIKVSDSDGVPCPYTKFGEGAMSPDNVQGSGEFVRIKPGATGKLVIPLADYFALKPGVWILDVLFKPVSGENRVALPKIEFTIPEAPKP